MRQEFFTPETLTEICSRLVTHYFLLTPAELELWDTDPENFGKYLYTYVIICILHLYNYNCFILYYTRYLLYITRYLHSFTFLITLLFSVVDDGGESWKYSLRVNISYSIIYKYL